MSKKMSYVSALNVVLNGEPMTEEVTERLNALKVSLEKRATHKTEGPTKAQKERAELAERVFAKMDADTVYTNADISKLIPELEGASSQKLSPLMKSLGERVTIEKDKKGKVTYKVAA